jgi:hypothetical protein
MIPMKAAPKLPPLRLYDRPRLCRSAKIAKKVGPFAGYHKDREGMNKVLNAPRRS